MPVSLKEYKMGMDIRDIRDVHKQENNGVRSSFLTVFWHNVKNEDLTIDLFKMV
jgi:hypothetical protein